MKLTKAIFEKAAGALEQRGEKLTQKSVRAEIGSGSYSDIGQMLREYRAEQEQIENAPLDVVEVLTRSADAIWTKARSAASLEFEGERKSFKDKIAELLEFQTGQEEVLKELEQQLAQTEQTLTSEREALGQTTEALEAVRLKLYSNIATAAKATERADLLQKQIDELKRAKQS